MSLASQQKRVLAKASIKVNTVKLNGSPIVKSTSTKKAQPSKRSCGGCRRSKPGKK